MNLVLGQGAVPTIRQFFFAFVLGSVFYAIRRISGTIVVVMVLHALWDFGSFSHVAGKAGAVAAKIDIASAGMGLLQSLVVFIAVILVIAGAKKILKPKAAAALAQA